MRKDTASATAARPEAARRLRSHHMSEVGKPEWREVAMRWEINKVAVKSTALLERPTSATNARAVGASMDTINAVAVIQPGKWAKVRRRKLKIWSSTGADVPVARWKSNKRRR